MNFWKLLFSFVPVYKWRITFYILLNILCSIVSIISFSAVVPLLYILFGLSNPDIQIMSWSDITSLSTFLDLIKTNILYLLQEQITHNGTHKALLILCAFVLLTSFISNIVSYYAYYVRIPIRTGISRDLRMRIYDKLVSLYPSAYKGENKGDFIGRMTTDIEEVDFGIGTAMDMLIENPVQIIIYLVTLFGISSSLASSAALLLLGACIVVVVIGQYMKTISLRGQSFKGKLISMYEETIEKNILIQVFNLQDYFHNKFDSYNNTLRKTHNKMNRVYSIAFPLTDFMSVMVLAIILFIGGSRVANGSIDIDAAELIYFVIIFHSIIRPTRSVIKATYGIRKAMASLDRMEHILNIESPSETQTNQTLDIGENRSISFCDVTFGYAPSNYVFQDLSFQIHIGEKCAIIGHNGKGKTSIVKLLLKLETDYQGDILICNQNIKDISNAQLRKMFSFVPQETLLFNDTILNNILLGNPSATLEEVYDVGEVVGIHKYILSLENGYETIIGEQGMVLSGGQKQSIAIARALLKKAPILILDEATSGIDSDTEQRIMSGIYDIMKDKTLIVITHNDKILNTIHNKIIID